MSAKYAPANDNGEKPYLVEKSSWGGTRKSSCVAYGKTPADAKYKAFGRMSPYEAITACRRATHEDMEAQER